MKAMLFAAGLGTRLRPLTNDRPKALVEVNGVTLLEVAIRRLKAAGCQDIIVNVHHFAGHIISFLEEKNSFGINIAISDEQQLLLDTGGGLKKAAWFFDDGQPFLVCNVDALTDIDLASFYQKHLESKALATLAVQHRTTSRYLLFDENMRLRGWKNAKTGEEKLAVGPFQGDKWQLAVEERHLVNTPSSLPHPSSLTPHPPSLIPHPSSPIPFPSSLLSPFAFSGIHAISPAIFNWMPAPTGPFSIIDVYLEVAQTGLVFGYDHSADEWLDVGKPEALPAAAAFLKKNRNFAPQ